MEQATDFAPIESVATGSVDEIRRLKGQYRDAFEFKQPQSKDWSRWYLLYSGRHWDGRQPEWMSTPVVNLTWSVINTILPILTDARPQITVAPRRPEMEHTASILRQLIEWLWEKNDLDVLLPKTMLNTLIFGNGFLKVMWDQTLNDGMGDIKIAPVDPSHIFVSPYARTLDEAEYVIHAENLPYDTVKRMFPALGPHVYGQEDGKLSLNRNITSQMPSRGGNINDTIRATDGSAVYNFSGSSADISAGDNSKLVTVYERWEKREDGMYQTVVANDQILQDGPSPLGHNKYPFVHFVDHPCTWTFWAMGEVQQVEKLQIEINRRRGHILDIIRFAANPILVVDPSSGVDYQSLVARPGLVIPAEGGMQSVGWLQPPNIPNALFEINQIDKQDFDVVLGNVDVLQGRRPAGVEAGVAIEMLQEAANVRMRLKVRHLENSIRKLGELLVSMIQYFYDTQRVFMVAGTEALMAEKPLTPDAFLTINQPQSASIGPDGSPMVNEVFNQIPQPGMAEFDIRVGPGSTLPVSRSHEFQKAITLFQMGILDDEGVMKRSGFPRWDEELMRSRMYWQQKMMEQSAMTASAPPEDGVEPATDDEINESMAETGISPDEGNE